ncbi:hypothetical protein [Mycobacterium conspicuum]|uniref:hypothetical protein n=1 Tax=Mycobacterium conspicuum TaxID=44010 RepID=UPI0013D3FA5E|nr:hypothetical protein [Mycobacterium conspicuum]
MTTQITMMAISIQASAFSSLARAGSLIVIRIAPDRLFPCGPAAAFSIIRLEKPPDIAALRAQFAPAANVGA